MTSDAPDVIGRSGSYAKGVARRREILDRAIEVFTERGADGTSLRRIAQALGVSHAALLHYFDSREQLLVAVYEHAETRRDDDADHPRPERAVDVMVDAAVQNVEVPGLVQLYSTLVAAALETDSVVSKDYFTSRFERVRATLSSELRRDQEAGLVRTDVDASDMAALIVAASDGLQIQWLLDPSIGLGDTLRAFSTLLAVPPRP
ncbi:MAG: TetR/AcrR family transcriptional regulator [Mycetocola sp.]